MEIELGGSRLRYREVGSGPPVVFVHGLLVNGELWRKVVPVVAGAGYRCLVPDWPLGAHSVPVPRADLTPPGVAALIADFLDALDLRDVTLIANDTGGAITQLVMADHPERIGRVVLTPCDCFEAFFPSVFAPLPRFVRIPGATWLLVQALRLRALHRLPMTFGWVAKRQPPADVVDAYLLPSRRDAGVRADLRRFVSAVHNRHTLAAAERLRFFTRPVLLAWAREDRLFPVSLARRLAAVLPDARLELIDDSYTFVPEDQPQALGRAVVNFLGATS
ncbi:alpha/beta fold hydrolase [Kutzneria kofuensis]|uniref:Pimeloyl-ACP methyl ester carboxylesterase n=1 Tax=Kutzneria kofuensis TaxID=103725 RepID=A0A7W9NID4_9PSEU|nr:alpha/beta hydrolase [Kutzneria kofuensis]MBB5893750.1 pimeloyl-ACP methyl ester carboxylesterase [Kutzneria kofuensis]